MEEARITLVVLNFCLFGVTRAIHQPEARLLHITCLYSMCVETGVLLAYVIVFLTYV